MNGLYVMDPRKFDDVYGPQERTAIEAHLIIGSPPLGAAELDPALLADVNVLVTAWGGPRLTAELLDAAPKLELVLYGAGSIRPIITPQAWERGVRITSAAAANAVAVAEFALAQILFSIKHGWRYLLAARAAAAPVRHGAERGANGAVVGLVGLGATGRSTAALLARHDVEVQAFDPHATAATAGELGVRLVGIEELFATSDVVSLHVPLLVETRGMVGAALLRSMRRDATLINTARGGLIREDELVATLIERPDLFAALDVTDPEPPVSGSPLFTLPNVVVTPHIAGSLGLECRRQGAMMAQELARYCAGEPLLHEVTEPAFARTA
ncbi:hydroxyacid dehydrogenase [Pseudonocardia sp. GCM10023141]|uniref:hydroxyacid dehydrogenase n=1 Tax=Pseudonocardia sp. GCM10023141 TaxID=3252653 RepID=UPI00360F1538